jgi:hypothetical protein
MQRPVCVPRPGAPVPLRASRGSFAGERGRGMTDADLGAQVCCRRVRCRTTSDRLLHLLYLLHLRSAKRSYSGGGNHAARRVCRTQHWISMSQNGNPRTSKTRFGPLSTMRGGTMSMRLQPSWSSLCCGAQTAGRRFSPATGTGKPAAASIGARWTNLASKNVQLQVRKSFRPT